MTKPKKELWDQEDMGKGGVPFILGKSVKHYCDNCIERSLDEESNPDGEDYKDQSCSYRTPATANKSQYYRNHVAKGECPNCHESLGIKVWEEPVIKL